MGSQEYQSLYICDAEVVSCITYLIYHEGGISERILLEKSMSQSERRRLAKLVMLLHELHSMSRSQQCDVLQSTCVRPDSLLNIFVGS